MDNKDIGALWTKTSAKGLEFLSGNIEIGGARYEIVLFKNTRKSKPNQPDWNIFASRPKEQAPREQALEAAVFPEAAEDSSGIPF